MRRIYICLILFAIGSGVGFAADEKDGKAADQNKIAKLDDTVLVLSDSAATLPFDWTRLAAEAATIAVLNKSSATVSVSAPAFVMSCDPPCMPITISVRPDKAPIGSYETSVFTLILPKDSQPDRYTGVFTLNDDAKKIAPLRQPVWIKPLSLKLATTIYRTSPCGNCFFSQSEIPVPLGTTADNKPLAGALSSDAGNVIFARWQRKDGDVDLVFDEPPAAGIYKGEIPWGPALAKTTVAVTVTAADSILWPLIVILLGTTLAFLVKRYLGVSRITLDLRRRDAELAELWEASRRQFLATAQNQPFAAYSLDADINKQRETIHSALAKIDRQWFRSSLDDKDEEYRAAVNGIAALQKAVLAWPDLGQALLKLALSLKDAHDLINGEDLIPQTPSPGLPVFAQNAQTLLQGSDVTLEQASALGVTVADQTATAISWIAAYKLSNNTTERYREIRSRNPTNQQKSKLGEIETKLIDAWKHIFDVRQQSDIDAITGIGSDLDTAEVAIRELESALAAPPAGAERLVPANFGLFRAEGLEAVEDFRLETISRSRTVDDQARAQILRDRIRRGDALSFVFAILISVLTGLNSYYFAQPFGTLKDYVGLFLWAAGTKATLDILGMVLDRFVGPRLTASS